MKDWQFFAVGLCVLVALVALIVFGGLLLTAVWFLNWAFDQLFGACCKLEEEQK